jgi:hypothetical protein
LVLVPAIGDLLAGTASDGGEQGRAGGEIGLVTAISAVARPAGSLCDRGDQAQRAAEQRPRLTRAQHPAASGQHENGRRPVLGASSTTRSWRLPALPGM